MWRGAVEKKDENDGDIQLLSDIVLVEESIYIQFYLLYLFIRREVFLDSE
jgi:hypothetical protein